MHLKLWKHNMLIHNTVAKTSDRQNHALILSMHKSYLGNPFLGYSYFSTIEKKAKLLLKGINQKSIKNI